MIRTGRGSKSWPCMTKVPAEAQIHTLYEALKHVIRWGSAVDGGANNGQWAVAMIERFKTVHAFEPMAGLCPQIPGVCVHTAALMDRCGTVGLVMPPKRRSDRSRHVVAGEDIPAVSVDALELVDCGLIKLDVEGAELFALRGAEETIKRDHPVLIVEVDRHCKRFGYEPKDLLGWIAAHGYREVYSSKPDVVFA